MASGDSSDGKRPSKRAGARRAGRGEKTCDVAKRPPELDPAQVRQVMAWFLGGASDHEVREAVAETWLGVDPQPLIQRAFVEFAAHSLRPQREGELPTIQDVVRGWAFTAYRDLYRKMVEIGDFAGALSAVAKIERMAEK